MNGAESRRTGEQHEPGPSAESNDHDTDAPTAGVVVPSVFVAVRDDQGRLLMVRRHDSGAWELSGGRVDVGESAVGAGGT